MYLTPQELVNARRENPAVNIYYMPPRPATYPNTNPVGDSFGLRYGPIPRGPITIDVARRINRSMLDAALRNQQAKVNRPWEIVNVSEKMDKDQPWVGFEFETGFHTLEAHARVVNYIWKYTRHVAIDREGPGSCPMEITFPPQELSKYKKNSSYIQKFLSWMDRNNHPHSSHNRYSGCHANISTPSFRKLGPSRASAITAALTNRIGNLSETHKGLLFGRQQPYGYGYYHSGNNGPWIEWKLFQSTYNREEFEKYIGVAFRIAYLMELEAKDKKYTYKSLYDVLRGAEEVSVQN